MKKQLIDKGWKNYYTCKCSGGIKQHFNNPKYPNYEIIIKIRTQTFRILQNNHVIEGSTFNYKIEEKLQAHGIGD